MEELAGLKQKIASLEKEAVLARESFELLINSTIDAIIMMTDDGRISLWNPAAARIFGHTREEAVGRDLHLLLAPPEYHDAYKTGYQRFTASGRGPLIGKLLELTAVHKDGHTFPISLSLSVTRVGEDWLSIGIIRDITDRKESEKALQEAHQDLEKKVEQRTVALSAANKELHEANLALKVLLKKSSEAGKEIEERILNNVDELVLPYIDELALNLARQENRLLLKIIRENIRKITSGFTHTLSRKYRNLTPREIQVADLIRMGRTTKEIAGLLNVSAFTIETYRANLRKKFELSHKKVNLRSFLSAISTD